MEEDNGYGANVDVGEQEMTERVLGIDYVVLQGRGGREFQNGANCKDDDHVHLGFLEGQMTACGRMWEHFMLTYSDVEIDCPDCIKELKKRAK